MNDSNDSFHAGFSPEGDTAASQSILLSEGDRLQEGRFEIKEFLGKGRHGSVYRVYDNQMAMNLALKIVAIPDDSTPSIIKYLVQEFRIREKIKDRSHILNGYLPVHCMYKGLSLVMLPMELAEASLRNWMIENPDVEKRKTRALNYFQQLCRGVGAIHDAGLVHLDLKPENILFVNDVLKIADFGLSSELENMGVKISSTKWNESAVAHYIAPESVMAARPKDVACTADIYSLGCILFELMDGDPPYVGTLQDILEKHYRGVKPKLKDVEEPLASILWKCLELDPSHRFCDVTQLSGALYQKDPSTITYIDEDNAEKLNMVHERFDIYWNASRPEEKIFAAVQQWIPDALDTLRQGAQDGDPDALYRLGLLYFLGDGVDEDRVEAYHLWKLAAELGHGMSQYGMGLCYDYGQGRPKDMKEALQWYRIAAEKGVSDAQNALGNCYYYGEGVEEDKAEAVRWYNKAAMEGNAVAQCNLGYCYLKGIGVPADEVTAEQWLRKASEQGYREATRLLETL